MTPLTEPVFLVLLSLAQAPRHGYALLKDTEALSDGRVKLSTGTSAIAKMMAILPSRASAKRRTAART